MDIIKNLWYMARRFKTATVLNLLGLTVAFTAFYLLITQVDYSRRSHLPAGDVHRHLFRGPFLADKQLAPRGRDGGADAANRGHGTDQ